MLTINELLDEMRGFEAKGFTGFGCRKYWIDDLHTAHKALGGNLTLDQFKAQLVAERNNGYWTLSRCDLPQCGKLTYLHCEASEIKYLNAEWHFVTVPE